MFIKTNSSKYKDKVYISKLLCESYWENGVSKTRKILNISKLPTKQQLAIEQSIKEHGPKVHIDDIAVEKSIDYGWVAIILETFKLLSIWIKILLAPGSRLLVGSSRTSIFRFHN